MNNVTLCGRFARDPEVKYTQSGMAIARFTLAIDRKTGKDKDKDKKVTDWPSCVAFGKQAEVIGQHFTKGMKIVLSGSIHTGSYEKNGQKIYTTDVAVNSFDFCEGKNSSQASSAGSAGYAQNSDNAYQDENPMDIPF